MDSPFSPASQANPDLAAITGKLFSSIPGEWRGGREECLFIFRAGETFIFEYKAFRAEGGQERKVLLWVLLRQGQLRRLTFEGLT
jgi:hypothetical protein